jgi:hypothetical protein
LFAAVIAAVANVAVGQLPVVKLQLFPLTGEVRISYDDPTDFTFIGYELKSPSGALNGTDGVWKSISDSYDASGNGFIDANNDWTELPSNAGVNATSLMEVSFPNPGGIFPAYRSLSLGKIWDPSLTPPPAAPDVTLKIFFSDTLSKTYDGERSVDGDYFRSDLVDALDYGVWRGAFGSTTANYADGNLDGIVNAADYTIWRNNLGACISNTCLGGTGGADLALSATAVPEPAGIFLGLLACAGCLSRRCWRQRESS